MDENSCKQENSTLRQTSDETKHDTHDGSPRTTIHNINKARPYDMEPPLRDVLEEDLILGERSKILKPRKLKLLRSNTLKDEELKTERKQNEEQIRNLQTKYDGKGREKKLEADSKELKDENKKINNELKKLKKELLRSNTLKDEELKTERKQNEEKSAIIERFEKQIRNLQAYAEELHRSKNLKDEKKSAIIEIYRIQRRKLQGKYEEVKGREKKLETENKELKDENKKINKELKELEKELLRSNALKNEELKTERKQNEEKSAIIERFEKQIRNLQAYDEGKGREKKLQTDNKELKDENKNFDQGIERT